MKIEDFVNKVMKEYGEKVYVPLDSEKEFQVIHTSSIGLNLATKVGGIPIGTVTEIFGREGAGKSTLSLDIAKNFLEQYDDRGVLYIDVENMMTPEYVSSFVGDSGYFTLVQPLTSEDALTIAEEGIESGVYGVVIVDSVGALAPKKEVESELTKESYSGSAKLIARFMRRVVPKVNHFNVALIMVNQVRDNVGSYVGGYSTPGGHSLKHLTTLRIMLSDSQKIREGDEIIGVTVKYTVKKNKLGSPYSSCEFPLIFGEGIDKFTDLIQTSYKLGILMKRGSYYYFEGEQIGQGNKQVAAKLRNDPELLDTIIELCYNTIYTTEEEVVSG